MTLSSPGPGPRPLEAGTGTHRSWPPTRGHERDWFRGIRDDTAGPAYVRRRSATDVATLVAMSCRRRSATASAGAREAGSGRDVARSADDQREFAPGHWLLQSAIAEVARQAKSRGLAAVVRCPEIRLSERHLCAGRPCRRSSCSPRTRANSVSRLRCSSRPWSRSGTTPDFGSRREPNRAWLLDARQAFTTSSCCRVWPLTAGMVVRPWADRGPRAPTRPSRIPRPAGIPQATPGHANVEPHRAGFGPMSDMRQRTAATGGAPVGSWFGSGT